MPFLKSLSNDESYESAERFRKIIEHAPIGMAIVALDGRWLEVNLALCKLVGYTPEELAETTFQDITHPDDLSSDLANIQRLLDNETDVYQMEKRYIHKGGWTLWVLLTASLLRDANGAPLYFISQIQDISERKRTEQALLESERKFRAIFDQTFQFIGLMTPDGTLVDANRTALEFAGLWESDVIGKPFWETPWWTHSKELQAKLREAVAKAGAGEFVRFEATHMSAEGRIHYVDFSLKPILDGDGKISLLIPEGRDITDRKALEWRLEHMAHVDPLTGMNNRRRFLELAELEFERARRYQGKNLSMLMLDLDHFKQINDTHGHPAGDAVLRKAAQACRESLRNVDTLGRLGGEEFAALLPETAGPRALQIAKRVCRVIAGTQVALDNKPPINVTASIGVASLSAGDTGVGTLLERADAALYEAKRAGRNRAMLGD